MNADADQPASLDFSERFEFVHVRPGEATGEDIVAGRAGLEFRPVQKPAKLDRPGWLLWLRTRIEPGELPANATLLELPGHLLTRVRVFYRFPDGTIEEYVSGRRVSATDRPLPWGNVVFPLPPAVAAPYDILVRMTGNVPLNFTARTWSPDAWARHVAGQRLWYGLFLGAILVLVIYNLFFAAILREFSYLFYVGYILSLAAAVFIYTPLPDEYLFRDGNMPFVVLTIAGFAVFFAIGFVNAFLRTRQRSPLAWKLSTAVGILAAVSGLLLAFRVYPVPRVWTANLMHGFLVLGAVYFLGISLLGYFRGIREARFLALSILPLLGGLTGFLLYTYGAIAYNPLAFHAIEIGALLEGILLSMALADRVNLLACEKERAEREALDAHRYYTRRLLKAQETDRERFASTLHDSIGHSLLVIKRNLEQMVNGRAADDGDALLRQVELSEEIISDVRGLSHDLHPDLLRRLGLKAALESTLDRSFSNTAIEYAADIGEIPRGLGPEMEITFYRVVQECINNVIKHSGASEVMLGVEFVDGQLHGLVKDDGIGFEPGNADDRGLGIGSMHERLELYGGRLRIHSEPGYGTEVRFVLPVAPPPA